MKIITSRRILHQPFFPASSFPPNQQTPFFPSYDSPPPPPTLTTPLTPPSPSAFASFPANVSSLDIPHSPKSNSSVSPSLLAVTIVAVLLAIFVVSVAVYYYCKRRDKHFGENSDTKTYRSDNNSHRLYPISSVTTNVNSTSVDGIHDGAIRKVRSNSSRPTSAEFLYLGNIANSRRPGDSGNVSSGEVVVGGGGLGERKLDSPELRPLPPLARYGANSGNVGFNGEEEEDEFYSPNGSYYSAGGSGSRRVFAAAAAAAVVELMGTSSESNSSSCSSSNSGSPIRSKTYTTSIIASPASLDHRRTSPSLSASPSPPASSSPERSPVYATQPQPPPPPPPPPLMARNLESQTPSPPIILRAVSKPPGLLISPPKPTPIVIQSPPKGSPETLPAEKSEDETPKPKLKPLHWDKVRASSDREMVWDQLKSSSFKLNEEMIESLFVVNTSNSAAKETNRRSIHPSPVQENRVLDPKKSQNIAIALRALNVTVEEVCEALSEGNADTLGAEVLESLLKMAPTKEEERKLKEYKDDSPFKLGPAERFLKEVLSIPFAFQRIDVMLYMANFESEVEYLKSSFETLEAACEELRNSRIFFKLLEAVLKTGNRMNVGTNRGDAHAFKLDTLLKLVDVKAADGKTTLLHFVVQEIIKSEGARLSDSYNQIPNPSINEDAKCRKLGLQVVSNLCSELTNVKKAAAMDSTVLTGEVVKLSNGIENIKGVTALIEEGKVKFSESANKFVNIAEEEIIRIQAQESVSLSLVKEITEYFHGNSAKEEAHPFRIFMVVRDFFTVLDRVCKDVGAINERTIVSSAHKFPVPVNPTIQAALPGIDQMQHNSSSDGESL